MKTPQTPQSTSGSRFDEELSGLHHLLDGQIFVTQDRCVDALLDLYNVAPNETARELLGEMMSDIRFVSAVRVQLLRDDLTLLSGCR